jgi:hypothetical protein
MAYERPELVTLDSACAGIEGGVKRRKIIVDILFIETIGAYESDE